jgi:hypothetical protein
MTRPIAGCLFAVVDVVAALWEQLNNPEFNSLEFEGIKNESGRNSFFLSVKKRMGVTGAIGLYAKAGRYGGIIRFKTACFNSCEYFDISPHLPPPAHF